MRAWLSLLLGLLAVAPVPISRADIIPPGCNGNGYGISLFVDKAVARVGDTLYYTLLLSNQALPACQAEEITAEIVTPDGVSHSLPLRRTVLDPGQSDLYRDVVAYIVRPEDVVNLVVKAAATSTAQINQSVTGIRSDNYRDVSTPVATSCLDLTAACNGGVGEAAPITFAGTLRNCGTTTLNNVIVSNSLASGPVFGPVSLAPGEQRTFTGSFTPPDPCAPATATLTAQGQDNLEPQNTVSDSVPITCQNTLNPAVVLAAECGAQPAGPGQPLAYSGVIRNSGNVSLTDLVVVASQPAADTPVFTIARLAPGESATFAASYPAPPACSSSIALTVNARTRCNLAIAANTTITCPVQNNPAVSLSSACPASPPPPGGRLDYTGTVRNSGDVALRNIRVFSEQTPSSPIFTVGNLSPGAAANFSGSLNTPTGVCAVTDTLTVIAENTCGGSNVTNTLTRTCLLQTAPAIQITAQCPPAQVSAGQSLNYTGTVRNTGNITLLNISVVSDQPAANTVIFTLASLPAGSSANFSATIPVPLDTCSVTYNLRASGRGLCSDAPVTATVANTCPITTSPNVEISSSCPESAPPAGSTLHYTARLRNTGNVTLTDIQVTSDRASGNRVVFTLASLPPGAETQFNGNFTTPTDACSVTDTLTVSARNRCTGAGLDQRLTRTCPLTVAGTMELAVNCPGAPGQPGQMITYSGTVRNPGTVTLNNLEVVNDAAPTTPVLRLSSLSPGQTAGFSAQVRVPTNVCSVTSTFTATATDRCQSATVRDTAFVTCPVASAPKLAVSHDCPTAPGAPGARVTFSGSVQNTGNITLNNASVTSSLAGPTPIFGPVALAPGEVAYYTASYTIPTDVNACTYRHTLTARGNDLCNGASVSATSNTDCPVAPSTGISILSSCPETAVAPGQQLSYTASVQNTGHVELRNVRVTDSQTGDRVIFSTGSLPVGASRTFTGAFTVPSDCCAVTHTLTVTAEEVCASTTVRDTSTTTCPVLYTPALTITKDCPSSPVETGDTLSFTGAVSNSGNVTLMDVTVSARVRGETAHVLGPIALAPNQSVNFQGSYVVPSNFCGDDELVATGHDLCAGKPATASAKTRCPGVTQPMLTVVKHCPTEPVPQNGTFLYSGTVFNTGNVILTNVTVVNSMPAAGTVVLGPITLAPGGSRTFTASYPIEARCCWVVDTLTAHGQDACTGEAVQNTATAVCDVLYAPALQLTKHCLDANRFTGVVRNTGNIVLTNVIVTTEGGGATVRLLGPIELAQGESAAFSSTAGSDVIVAAAGEPVCGNRLVTARVTCAGPVAPEPEFTDIALLDGTVVLRWSAIPGRTYRVQYSPVLSPSAWQNLPGDVTAQGTVAVKTDSSASQAARFYRVLLLP